MSEVPFTPHSQFNWLPGADPQTSKEIDDFFHSPAIQSLKELMCGIGCRLWQREFVDGNGGNLTIRVGDDLVLCTPTGHSKGFMTTDMICLVDMKGRQLAGSRVRTSEILTHLGVMKRQPDARACCHAHPPIATGFAVAGVVPDRFLTPEAEVFLGEVGLSEYQEPGSVANGCAVGKVAAHHMCVLMRNHGVMTRGKHLEIAYWRMENIEALCRTFQAARTALPKGELPKITGEEAQHLLELYERTSAEG